MGTSQRAFDQVKNILGRLDRNIDAVRERRVGGPPASPASENGASNGQPAPNYASGQARPAPLNGANNRPSVAPARFAPDDLIGVPRNPLPHPSTQQPAAPTPPASKSPWGRAQPIRRDAGAA